MSKLHSTLVDGLARKNSEKWQKWQVFRMVSCHFKMHLCDVEPVVEMIYEATAAPARLPFGRTTAISVCMHASEIERRRRLSALSHFTWNTATIGGLEASSRGWVRSGARVTLRRSTARVPFSRAHLDRVELPAAWRDLLVRSRATA
jgi:hypothetical protein